MRGFWSLSILALGLLSGAIQTSDAAPGCPFCPPTQPTFSEQLAESDLAFLVTWVSSTEVKSEDEAGSATTTFEIAEAVRSVDQKLARKSRITVDFLRNGAPGDQFLLFGKLVDGKPAWSAPIEMSEDSYQYIRQAPALEKPSRERLRYFLKFLEYPESQIANDAFAEFSRAPYADVSQLSDLIPREKVRRWLQSPETTKVRLGFYGLLLGLCGNDDDAEFLEAQIFAPAADDEVRLGIDGMMGGYLLLRRNAGLTRLVERTIQSPRAARTDLFAALNALRFSWEYCRDRLAADDLRAALRLYLDQPEFAELVLADLSRWKDWSVLDRLTASFGKEPLDTDSAKLKIILFAQACVKDRRDANAGASPAAKAKSFLEQQERESPELMRQVRRPLPINNTDPRK